MDLIRSEAKENILIIDDVTTNLIALTDIIREAGYMARPVTSVAQAMKAITASLPNLILLDVTMPQMNGYEYCRILKKDPETRDIPVIFISALTSAADRVRGFECGAVDFISKPFEKTEVLMRVNTHLKIFRMQKDLEESNRQLHGVVMQQLGQLEVERRNMVIAMATLSEDRDDSSGTHLINISKNCRLIATGLSLTHKYEKVITNEYISTIETASKLHDIGKIAIPDRILLKEGKLNTKERNTMMDHTVRGVELLKNIYSSNAQNTFIKMAMEIAHYHHEKWDGSGYPERLEGVRIPLSARIMAVVDTYDALVSTRCYKPAYTHEAAIAIIKNESGKSFDPDIVNIFCRLSKRLNRNNVAEKEISTRSIPEYEVSDGRR